MLIMPIKLLTILAMLIITYIIGKSVEQKHFQKIAKQELRLKHIPAITIPYLPDSWHVKMVKHPKKEDSMVVNGNVVISQDYFKSFLAGLKTLIGGRLYSYETLLNRARREAVVRMKIQALELGYNSIIGVRFETSQISQGVEVIVYGTALKVVEQTTEQAAYSHRPT